MRTAFVSFRFAAFDGVSVETSKWRQALGAMGWTSTLVGGAGPVDHVLPGLDIGATEPPTAAEVHHAVEDADVVVVENLCSLPLNPAASAVVAAALKGRPAVLHHHDLPWQRKRFASVVGFPPRDPAWRHVTINHLSARQLGDRGIAATAVPNCFDTQAAAGDRTRTRAALGVGSGARLLLHPTRAIARKNVPAALRLARGLDAVYWLLGPAEDGYGPELESALSVATVRVIRGCPPGISVADAYAASDAVTLPSTWEGFGNATIESAVHRKPLAVSAYPVAREIAAFGFRWFPAHDARPLRRWLDRPDPSLLDLNQAIAGRHFSLDRLRARLAPLFNGVSGTASGAPASPTMPPPVTGPGGRSGKHSLEHPAKRVCR